MPPPARPPPPSASPQSTPPSRPPPPSAASTLQATSSQSLSSTTTATKSNLVNAAPSRPPPPVTSSGGSQLSLSLSASGSTTSSSSSLSTGAPPARPPPPSAAPVVVETKLRSKSNADSNDRPDDLGVKAGQVPPRPKSTVGTERLDDSRNGKLANSFSSSGVGGGQALPSRPPPPSAVTTAGGSVTAADGAKTTRQSPSEKRLKRTSIVDDAHGKKEAAAAKKTKKEAYQAKRLAQKVPMEQTPLPQPLLVADALTAEEKKEVYLACAMSVYNQMDVVEDEHRIQMGDDPLSQLAMELVGFDVARHEQEQQRMRTAVNCVRRLRVRLEGAKDLTAKHGDTSNPYISVDFQGMQHATPIAVKSLDPSFDEQFEFVVERACGSVSLNVWSAHDATGGKRDSEVAPYNKKDKFLGMASLSLADVIGGGGTLRKMLVLEKRSERSHVTGTVSVTVTYASSLAGKNASPAALRNFRRLADMLLARDHSLAPDGSLRDALHERMLKLCARVHGLSRSEDAALRLERAVSRSLPPMDADCAQPLAALSARMLEGAERASKSPSSSSCICGKGNGAPELAGYVSAALDGIVAYAEGWLKLYRDKFSAESIGALMSLSSTLTMVQNTLSLRQILRSSQPRESEVARTLGGWLTDVKRLGYHVMWEQTELHAPKVSSGRRSSTEEEDVAAAVGARLGEEENTGDGDGGDVDELWRECVRLTKISSKLLEDVKDDADIYAATFARAKVDIVAISLEVVCPMHAEDLRELLGNAEPDNVSAHVFELYRRVRRLYRLCHDLISRNGGAGKGGLVSNPYERMCDWFSPFMYVWLRTAARKTDEWSRNAMAQDNLEFIADGVLHSSSAVDIFGGLSSGLEFIKDLDWPDKQESSVFYAKYFDIVNAQVKNYAVWLREAIARASSEMDVTDTPEAQSAEGEGEGQSQPSQQSRGAAISTAMCAALNNVAQCYEQTCLLRDAVLTETDVLAADDSRRVLISDLVMEAFRSLSSTMETLVDAFSSKLAPAIKDGLLYVGGQGEKKQLRAIAVLKKKVRGGDKVKGRKEWDSKRKESLLKRLRWKRGSDPKAHSDIDDLLEPLTNYLDTNLEMLAQYLYEDVFRHVLLALWERGVLKSVQDMIMHPGDADSADAKRTMAQKQFVLVRKAVDKMRWFLHADGDGLPLEDLDSKEFKSVCLMLRLGSMDAPDIIAEYYRTQADKTIEDISAPKGVNIPLLISQVELVSNSGRISVRATLDSAMDLPPMDATGTCSAYVTAKVVPGDGKEVRTAVKVRSSNPVFNEALELPMGRSASEVVLVLTVWHSQKEKDEQGPSSGGVFLGEAVVALTGMSTRNVTVHTTPLMPSNTHDSRVILALLAMRREDKVAQEFVRQHKGAVLGRKEGGGKLLDLSFSGDSKVHSVNGHLFRATHFNHPVFCRVCDKMLVGLGKQGYRCDRCLGVCHKKCHTNTDACSGKA